MLPEIILREERRHDYALLFSLGLVTALLGTGFARLLFPSKPEFAAVMLAAVPLVYPLMKVFLQDEEERNPHVPEIFIYFSLFSGQALGFYLMAIADPSFFSMQLSVFDLKLAELGITGYAVKSSGFTGILVNNITVFGFVLAVSSLVGSAGAFILSWNASVLGVFLATLTSELSSLPGVLTGSGDIPAPIAFFPHAALEMSGFIVAGILGTMVSAAVYRRHFDREIWLDFGKTLGTGLSLVLAGASLEAGVMPVFGIALLSLVVFSAWMR